MNIFASDILFYVFGALAVILSLMVVFMRNPVSSAMMMALSFCKSSCTPGLSWFSSRSSSCC